MSAMLSQIADYLDRANALIESLTKERDELREDRDSQQRVAIKAMERVKELEEDLRCALDEYEGNNGRITSDDDPHWSVSARQALKDQPT